MSGGLSLPAAATISVMGSNWSSAPLWLKAACIVGIPWFLALFVIGAPLLLKDGPGLPVIWLGMLGIVPWILLALRDLQDRS